MSLSSLEFVHGLQTLQDNTQTSPLQLSPASLFSTLCFHSSLTIPSVSAQVPCCPLSQSLCWECLFHIILLSYLVNSYYSSLKLLVSPPLRRLPAPALPLPLHSQIYKQLLHPITSHVGSISPCAKS